MGEGNWRSRGRVLSWAGFWAKSVALCRLLSHLGEFVLRRRAAGRWLCFAHFAGWHCLAQVGAREGDGRESCSNMCIVSPFVALGEEFVLRRRMMRWV